MKYLLIFLCLFSVSMLSFAQSVQGSWQGAQIDKGLPVVVNIDITQLSLKDKTSSITYAMPRNCKISLEYAGEVEKENVFYVYYTNTNSWCESNVRPPKGKSSYLKVKLADNGNLIYELFKSGTRIEGGTAKRL